MPKSEIPHKTMYRVEKYLPLQCPNCRHPLTSYKEFGLLLGDIKDGKKVPRQPPGLGCDTIICDSCEKATLRIMFKVRQIGDIKEAKRLMAEEGFSNFQVVKAYGNATQDFEIVYYKKDDHAGEVISLLEMEEEIGT